MTGLLVIHDLGTSGGDEWAHALHGWPGEVHAPDLPGHGDAPAPVGGHHELGDAAFHLAGHLDREPGVVLGVGRNGHTARLLAVGGRAQALVLVDGLGGPWLDVAERHAALREVRRRILTTPGALVPHRPPGTDVRATMVLGATDRDHAVRTCRHVRVPTLVLESPVSPTPDAPTLVTEFPDARLTRVPDPSPATVAEVVVAWWDELR